MHVESRILPGPREFPLLPGYLVKLTAIINEPTLRYAHAHRLVPLLANFALFQSVWLITVIAASRDLAWPGVAALGFFLVVHAAFATNPRTDYALCVLLVLFGTAIESINISSGLLVHRPAALEWAGGMLPPLWLLVLWCNLALILDHGLRWLQPYPLLAAALGSAGGALSYMAGVALGAAEFGIDDSKAIIALAATWAVVTPLALYLARALHRLSERDAPSGRIYR